MHNAKKHFTVFLSAMALSLASLGTSISAFAEEVETTKSAETMAVSEASESTAETDNQLSEEDMKKLVDEIQDGASKDEESESDESAHDYYADDYYDTDGNATLIKHEKIIYESEEMQFIAVTTKDGNVFYILINYSADGDEDNAFSSTKLTILTCIPCSMQETRVKRTKTLRNSPRSMRMLPQTVIQSPLIQTVQKNLQMKQTVPGVL